MRPRLSLAGQFLVLQLVVVLLVVIAVAGVSLAQADIVFRNTEGARLRSLAESVASNDSVRLGLVDPGTQAALDAIAESARGGTGASYVLVADEFRELLNGPDARQPLEIAGSTVLSGRSWVGEIDNHLVAHVPVLDSGGRPIGLIAAGRRYPTLLEQLAAALPNLLTYLVVGCLLGMGGSLLLSRRVKRQTLGLEAREIVGLAEHREAMLHGIKEGVVAVDPEGRITLANDEAIRLLGLPDDLVGRDLGSLGLNRRLRSVLTGRSTGTDVTVLHADRVLVLNHTPIGLHGNSLGSVTTLRDRTEMVAMQHELDVTRYATDALHSQARAFTNRLRAIGGLLDRHRYDDARRYAGEASQAYDQIMEEIGGRVADPGVAALLVAKASLAAAHGVRLPAHAEVGSSAARRPVLGRRGDGPGRPCGSRTRRCHRYRSGVDRGHDPVRRKLGLPGRAGLGVLGKACSRRGRHHAGRRNQRLPSDGADERLRPRCGAPGLCPARRGVGLAPGAGSDRVGPGWSGRAVAMLDTLAARNDCFGRFGGDGHKVGGLDAVNRRRIMENGDQPGGEYPPWRRRQHGRPAGVSREERPGAVSRRSQLSGGRRDLR